MNLGFGVRNQGSTPVRPVHCFCYKEPVCPTAAPALPGLVPDLKRFLPPPLYPDRTQMGVSFLPFTVCLPCVRHTLNPEHSNSHNLHDLLSWLHLKDLRPEKVSHPASWDGGQKPLLWTSMPNDLSSPGSFLRPLGP